MFVMANNKYLAKGKKHTTPFSSKEIILNSTVY